MTTHEGAGRATPAQGSKIAAWRLAIRIPTLPAAVGPVLVGLGVGLAQGAFRLDAALLSLAVALLLQVAANLSNDLFDHLSGADAADRLGPPRAAALGLLTTRELGIGTAVVLVAAALVGLGLVAIGGPVLLALGAAAIVAAVAYTGGPFPYGYRGLGELFVFAFFGLVAVAGTAYLQTGQWSLLGLAAAVPVGALVTAILVVNNLRDIKPDRRAGKWTLAARLGGRFAQAEYVVLLAVAALVPPALWIAGMAGFPVLLPLLSAPLAVPLVRTVLGAGDPRGLNPVLKGTARLQLVYAALFAAGLALPGLGTGPG
ncbi:MAG TPA: 1,4-dihydroxy-2-naphthoate polyprenyltransferase [Candidatus Limnocylindrales bacterium]|nr:1,4-dihydroxy-2-naphthoate polyprenyltransferase [Candidatus Limnocylindrales bacterium]